MFRTSSVIFQTKPLQGEARRLRIASVFYCPDNDRRSIHYPLHMSHLNMERTLDDNTGICHNGVEQLKIPAEEDSTVQTGE